MTGSSARDPSSSSLVAPQAVVSFPRSPLSEMAAPTLAIGSTSQLARMKKGEGKGMSPPFEDTLQSGTACSSDQDLAPQQPLAGGGALLQAA